MVVKIGDENTNFLDGTPDADILKGLGGSDSLEGFAGADRLDGGAGSDRAIYESSNAGVFVALFDGSAGGGHAEGDTLVSIENVTGSLFADTIFGDDGANFIDGFGGQDVIKGLGGDDEIRAHGIMEGNDGDDSLRGGFGADTLVGGADDDRLDGREGGDTLNGGAGIDTIVYDASDEGVTILLDSGGFAGSGSGGDAQGDVILGIENVGGSSHDDVVFGNELSNVIRGLDGADVLKGAGGADVLKGEIGNDNLVGGEGADLLIGGFDADILEGGGGIDTADYFESDAAVTINLAQNTASGGDAQGDTFFGVENIDGSQFGDTLIGDGLDNGLFGDEGADTLKGGGGADRLFGSFDDDVLKGGGGADRLDGGSGADRMVGGEGDDTYVVDQSGDSVDEALGGSGVDTVDSRVSFSLASDTTGDVENLTLTGNIAINGVGNALANTLTGNAAANDLNGNSGADVMRGRGGDDDYVVNEAGDVVDESLSGSSGEDDVLSFVSFDLSGPRALGSVENLRLAPGGANLNAHGNALDNEIVGNNGVNVITGAAGDDTLTGGGGGDFFVFATALSAATNVDEITDFNVAQDTMRLENAFFTGLAGGALKASAFRIGTAAADGTDRVVYNDDTGALFFDRDGAGGTAQVRFATLDADLALTNADFLVI